MQELMNRRLSVVPNKLFDKFNSRPENENFFGQSTASF